MEEIIKILEETYKGLEATEEELFAIAHKLFYRKEINTDRQNTDLVVEDDYEEIEIQIGDFVEFNEALIPDLEVDLMNNFYIETPSGWTRINQVVKKSKNPIVELELENKEILRVAEGHLFPQYNGTNLYATETEYIITKKGKQRILKKESKPEEYVYDIGINSPNLYYTANGVLNHNSAFMASQAANMILKGKKVLYVTLEMSEEETAKRIDANILDVDINELRNTGIEVLTEKFNKIKDVIGELIIKEYSAGTFNIIHLETLLQELSVKNFVPDAIFIDYIGLMASSRISLSAAGGTYGYIKSIAEELHGFAKRFDTRIITASQLNRGAYGNVNAGLESVSDSIGLVQTADVFYFIINSDAMKEANQVLIKFEKNRNTGMLNSILMEVDFPKMRYTDYEGDDYIDPTEQQEKTNTEPIQNPDKDAFDFGSLKF